MRQICFSLIALIIYSSGVLAGEIAKSGQWGIQTSLGVASSPVRSTPTIGLKFMASENFAVRVETGFNTYSPANGGGTITGYAVGAGFEYHMTAVGSVWPYVGLQTGYGGGSNNVNSTRSSFGVAGVWGGEYFFSSNFSLGGEVGVGFTSTTNVYYANDINGKPLYGTDSAIGTGSATMIATWYLN